MLATLSIMAFGIAVGLGAVAELSAQPGLKRVRVEVTGKGLGQVIAGMMGQQDQQDKLFYMFRLADRVDFNFIREVARPYYSHTWTPSVDPVVVFQMGLLGYFYGITSERRLADERRLNMAFMWFLGDILHRSLAWSKGNQLAQQSLGPPVPA